MIKPRRALLVIIETIPEPSIPEIRLATGKAYLNQPKTRYMVPIVRTDPHTPHLHGILTIRQAGFSGITPTKHEARIYLAKDDDSTPDEIVEHRVAWQRFTPQVMFLSKDKIAEIAFDLIREYQNSLNNPE